MTRTSTCRQRAFTLVEVTIVMLILGIIAVIATPRLLDALSYHRVEAASQRIRHDLQFAQRIARTKSTQQSVTFDVAANSYSLPGVADFDRSANTYTVRLGEAPMMATLDAVDFGGAATVVFNGYGLPNTSGSVTVLVGTQQRIITVQSDGSIAIQ